jgi:hypothetical protein
MHSSGRGKGPPFLFQQRVSHALRVHLLVKSGLASALDERQLEISGGRRS